MATQRQRPQSQRGDFTGNKKQALIKEHEDAVNARRDELSIESARQDSIREQGTVDLMSGQPVLEHPEIDPDQMQLFQTPEGNLDVEPKPEVRAPEGERMQSTQGGEGLDVYEIEEEPISAQTKVALTPESQNAPTLIRVLYDLEEVTIGYGNTYNFKANTKYRVPRWVAAHLEEKDLCIVLSLQPA